MNRTKRYQITTCTACRHRGTDHCPGLQMLTRLSASIGIAGSLIDETFEISGTASVAACDRPCTVAYHGSRDTAMLFGDVDPDDDIADLLSYARSFAASSDGWSGRAPEQTDASAFGLVRVPSAIIVIEDRVSEMC